jgi:hypothetical protein
MSVKGSSMFGVAGLAVAAGVLLMHMLRRTDRMKKLLEELDAASKHITTKRDAALVSMKCNVLGVRLLHEIKESLTVSMEDGRVRNHQLDKKIEAAEQATVIHHEELLQLLQRLADRLAPQDESPADNGEG